MKKIVIIGAGIEQVYAYELAKRNGYYVIGTDNDPKAPAIKYADFFILASTRDHEETLQAIKTYTKKYGYIDGVMTIANDVPYTVAYVAEHFNLKGHSLKSALIANDKYLMKKAFKKNGVRCPNYFKISSLNELKQIIHDKNINKFILKPIDGRGARGVLLLNKDDNLDLAYQESLSWSESNSLILEEYISGMQISSESYIFNGKAYTPALSQRNYSRLEEFSPYIIEDGGTIPAPLDDNMVKKINKLIEQGAKAMGVNEGIVKGDIVIDKSNQPQIIELALRLSGGWLASNQIIETSGVDLVDVVMKQALGIKINEEMLTPKFNKSVSVRYWFPNSGKLTSIEGAEEIKNLPGLVKFGLFRKVGQEQPIIKMHADRFGFIIMKGEDREESLSRVNKAISLLKIEVS